MEGSLWNYFDKAFTKREEKTAISFLRNGRLETEVSYGMLNRDAGQLAAFFYGLGVEKGDRVILFLPKSVAFVVAHLAIQRIGAITVPLNPGFTKSEMTYLLGDIEAKLVVAGIDQASMVREIDPRIGIVEIPTNMPYQSLSLFQSSSDILPDIDLAPDDPGLMIYTSGTTGKPKGAVLTQKNLIHDAVNIINIWEMTDRDVLYHVLPLFHIHGLCFALHTSLRAGSHIIILDEFSPKHILPLLSSGDNKVGCSVFMGVPAMYLKMMDNVSENMLDFSAVRLWASGSAPLLPEDFEKIKSVFGKEPVEREGMSETGMNFSNPLKGLKKPGSIGLPLPDLEVRIVDITTHMDVKPGETGEIWLKGPSITPGYWRKSEATHRAFENGWFRTGDLGKIDEDGYYYITDRIKHIIISGGENVSPKEVESVILQCKGVAETSVVGIPDKQWGEKVVAVVVLKPGETISAEQIRSFCREHLHSWKAPKQIIFLKALPRNTMGKVLKEDIKALFLS